MIIAALPGKHSMVTGQQHADGGVFGSIGSAFLVPEVRYQWLCKTFPARC